MSSATARHGIVVRAKRKSFAPLLIVALTTAAFCLHGYHYGIEDEAIYLPAVKKLVEPSLYPHDSEFFMAQARGTVLPWIIAANARATRLPLPWIVMAAQFVSIALFLFGCWCVTSLCFPHAREQAGALVLVAVLLTLPIAGTGLYLVDQHLHPRTLASAFVLVAIAKVMERRLLPAIAACATAFLIHPLMAAYGVAFVVLLALPLRDWSRRLAAIPFLASPTAAWREAVATREYYTLWNWEWYEWLGILAPFAVVWWLARLARIEGLDTAASLLKRLLLYAGILGAVTLCISLPRAMDFLWPLQPFRYLHTVYLLMALMGGGLLARLVLKGCLWRWAVAMLPLAAIMSFAQSAQFPNSPHFDIPGAFSGNRYVEAFQWVRDNTPRNAYFALDPEYMSAPLNDHYGFRAIAERSQMADISKDAAVVTVAPQLAPRWKREADALRGWRSFTQADLGRLQHDFGVDWVVVELTRAAALELECPYHTAPRQLVSVAVCRISSR